MGEKRQRQEEKSSYADINRTFQQRRRTEPPMQPLPITNERNNVLYTAILLFWLQTNLMQKYQSKLTIDAFLRNSIFSLLMLPIPSHGGEALSEILNRLLKHCDQAVQLCNQAQIELDEAIQLNQIMIDVLLSQRPAPTSSPAERKPVAPHVYPMFMPSAANISLQSGQSAGYAQNLDPRSLFPSLPRR